MRTRRGRRADATLIEPPRGRRKVCCLPRASVLSTYTPRLIKDYAMAQTEETAFPRLTSAELALVKPLAKARDYADGEIVFRAGQPEIDLYVVESGQIEIRSPTDGDRLIAVHEPGHFSGDIDVLTGRPVIVTAVANGPTRLLCVPNGQLRTLLNRVSSLGEKLIIAFTRRRELLAQPI